MALCSRCAGNFDPRYMHKDTAGKLVCRVCAGDVRASLANGPKVYPGLMILAAAGTLAVAVVLLILFTCSRHREGAVSGPVAVSTPEVTEESPATAEPTPVTVVPEGSTAATVTVYVDKASTVYHIAGCRCLSGDAVPVKLEDAQKTYAPCTVCHQLPADGGLATSAQHPSSAPSSGGSDRVSVRGYYRKDGTYVAPHTRSRPKR